MPLDFLHSHGRVLTASELLISAYLSDDLLHSVGDRLSLEQVEFNTISSSVPLLCIGMFILFVFLNFI
jgi:hypothetical protein